MTTPEPPKGNELDKLCHIQSLSDGDFLRSIVESFRDGIKSQVGDGGTLRDDHGNVLGAVSSTLCGVLCDRLLSIAERLTDDNA